MVVPIEFKFIKATTPQLLSYLLNFSGYIPHNTLHPLYSFLARSVLGPFGLNFKAIIGRNDCYYNIIEYYKVDILICIIL